MDNNNGQQQENVTFEKALTETKFGIFNYYVIIISGSILSNVFLETTSISFVLPVSCELNFTMKETGALSAIGFGGIIMSSHIWGFLADTTGRRRLIRPTLQIAFIITIFSSFSNSFWILLILRFLNGVFVSGGYATVFAFLGEFHAGSNRGKAIMIASLMYAFGAMLMPIIAFLVINQEWSFKIELLGIIYKPWRLFLIVCGLPGFVCGLCLYTIPESPKFLFSIGKEEKALEILRIMFHYNTGQEKNNYPIKSIVADPMDVRITNRQSILKPSNSISFIFTEMWKQTALLFSKKFLPQTTITCLLQFLNFITAFGMYMWFPHVVNLMLEFSSENPYKNPLICDVIKGNNGLLNNTGTQDNQQCQEKLEIFTFKYSLVLGVFYVVGFGLLGLVINVIGKKKLLFIILVTSGSCGISIIFVNIPILSIYMYIILLCCGLAIEVVNVATVELFPTRLRAMALCISLMLGNLGSLAGTNIFGLLLINYCNESFLFSGITLIVAGFIGFLMPNPPKERRKSSFTSITGN